jgi:hypothetical protein
MNDMFPEEQDPQFEDLITLLRQIDLNPPLIDSTEREKIIAHARERLFSTEREMNIGHARERRFHRDAAASHPEDMPTPEMPERGSFPSKLNAGTDKPHRRSRRMYLSAIAALLVVVASIGSLLLILGPWSPFDETPVVGTPVVGQIDVPDLTGMSWAEALKIANAAGFHLMSTNGNLDGVVITQSPTPHTKALEGGGIILVQMQVKKATVPSFLKNSSLATVEQILKSAGFDKYTVTSDGMDLNLPPNTVSRVIPSPGSLVAVDTQVIIYVKNLKGTLLFHIEPITASSL